MKKCENASSDKKRKLRNDVILAAVILIIAAAGLLFINLTKTEGNTVVVKIDGVEKSSYSLSRDTSFEIKTGKDNKDVNVVVIKDSKVYVTEANCPDGICKDYRPISNVGETIICLPHRVVIEITGEKTDSQLDLAG